MTHRFLKSLFLPMILLLAVSCGGSKASQSSESKPSQNQDIAGTFKYDYNGPALGPQFSRRYHIEVTPNMAQFWVDDFSKELYRDSASLTSTAFNNFVQSIKGCNLKPSVTDASSGICVGGHSEDLLLFKGTASETNGKVITCGGEEKSSLTGNYAEAIRLFKTMVPKVVEIMKSGGN